MRVCFSAYQCSLNELYLIASPAIESLYSARENQTAAEEYLILLRRVTLKLWQWRHRLPAQLSLDLDHDSSPDLELTERAHRLQALSLHLTFDSLQIILHRPFLKQQLQIMRSHGLHGSSSFLYKDIEARTQRLGPTSSASSDTVEMVDVWSPSQWWEAAVRTARTTELFSLTRIATDTHLVSFFALNLFNAAIVMVVLALSDPLHEKAQQAKRAITRIYRLQTSLGSRSVLSKQSCQVIHTLVELLLRRERETILEPFSPTEPAIPQDVPGRGATESRRASAHPLNVLPVPGDVNVWDWRDWNDPSTMNNGLAMRLDSSLESVQKGTLLRHFRSRQYL